MSTPADLMKLMYLGWNLTFSPLGFVQIALKTDPETGPVAVFLTTLTSSMEINATPEDCNRALYGTFPCFCNT